MIRLYVLFIAGLVLMGCGTPDPMARMPKFPMILPDNGGLVFTDNLSKDFATMFVYFDPDCKGCQDEAALIKQKMEEFKHVQIFFLSTASWEDISYFRDYFHLEEHDNVFFGRDIDTFLVKHFDSYTTPLVALYDQHKNLKAIIEGKSDLTKLLETIEEIHKN
jgi:5S rRNA maturation endonuclease (ribonuclease M5)